MTPAGLHAMLKACRVPATTSCKDIIRLMKSFSGFHRKVRSAAAPGHNAPAERRTRIIRWLIAASVLLLYARFAILFGYDYRGTFTIDLPSYYTASTVTFNQRLSPYDLALLQRQMDQKVLSYIYPPPSLLFFYPLSRVSFADAQLMLLAFNHVLVLVTAYLSIRALRLSFRRDSLKVALLLGYFFFFTPIVMTLKYGQVGLLLLALLLAFWLSARANRPLLAGALLACAIALKAYPALLLPLLLASRRYREAVATIAWSAVIAAVAAVTLPWQLWSDWLFKVIPVGGYGRLPADLGSPAQPWNVALYGFIGRLFVDTEQTRAPLIHANSQLTASALTYLSVAGLIGISMAVMARTSRRPLAARIDQIMVVGLPLMFLAAPLSWMHHGVHLLPAIVVHLVARPQVGRWLRAACWLLVGAIAFALSIENLVYYFPAVAGLWLINLLVVAQKPPIEVADPDGARPPAPRSELQAQVPEV